MNGKLIKRWKTNFQLKSLFVVTSCEQQIMVFKPISSVSWMFFPLCLKITAPRENRKTHFYYSLLFHVHKKDRIPPSNEANNLFVRKIIKFLSNFGCICTWYHFSLLKILRNPIFNHLFIIFHWNTTHF